MSTVKRMVRVNELLLRELGLLCEQLIMPHAGSLVTVTSVDTAPDLRQAVVRVSVLGDAEQRAKAMHLMHANRKEMQAEIGRRVGLKYTPRLVFKDDFTPERAGRVLAILDEIGLPPGPEPEPGLPPGSPPES